MDFHERINLRTRLPDRKEVADIIKLADHIKEVAYRDILPTYKKTCGPLAGPVKTGTGSPVLHLTLPSPTLKFLAAC